MSTFSIREEKKAFPRSRYVKLKDDWMLRGWTDLEVLLINRRTGFSYKLGPTLACAAQACNGYTDFSFPDFLPDHMAALQVLTEKGIVEECARGTRINPWQEYKKAPNPFVQHVRWSVTGFCNLNCRHCYVEAPSHRYGELPLPEMIRLIDQFERANVCEVSLTGGEPFIRTDFLQIMQELAKRRIRVSMIFTNSLLITEDILQQITELGISPTIRISFDGCGCHDMMRGSQDIEKKVIDAIRQVTSAGLKVLIGTCIDKTNAQSLYKTYELMKTLGISAWRISRPTKAGNYKKAITELSKEKEMAVYSRLLKRWNEDERPFHLQLGRFPRTDTVTSNAQPRFTHDSFDCQACRKRAFIMADGTILPCTEYIDTDIQSRMPNLMEQEFSSIWTESALRSILDTRKGDILAHNEECLECTSFPDCGAGCRARAFLETADLMAKDPVECTMQKRGYMKKFYDQVSNEKEHEDIEPDYLLT